MTTLSSIFSSDVGSKTFLLISALLVGCLATAPKPANAQAATGATFTTLYTFGTGEDSNYGTNPDFALVVGADGNLYSTVERDLDGGYGSIYKVTPSGNVTTIYYFDGSPDGYDPFGLTLDPDGDFYGSTANGGQGEDYGGTIFKVTNTGALTTLTSFYGNGLARVTAPLVLGVDGNYYGTAAGSTSSNSSEGSVIKVTPTGDATSIYNFKGTTDGIAPDVLTLGSDGDFYGITVGLNGASGNYGGLYKVTPAGRETTLFSFTNDAYGGDPDPGLVQGSNGNFYGLTEQGGTNGTDAQGDGTAYEITPNGALTTLFQFDGAVHGSAPAAPLILGTDGNFYGTTTAGGANGNGTVFQMTPSGSVTTLHTFDNNVNYDGAGSSAALLETGDGSLWGTSNGGETGYGTLYTLSVPSLASTAPPHISSVTFGSSSVTAGTTLTANQINFNRNAAVNTPVTITSSNTAAANITTTPVSVPAGSSSEPFTIATSPVSSTQTVTIAATEDGVSRASTLTVTPAQGSLKTVTLSPANIQGGASSTSNRVYLNGNAVASTPITVTSSDPSVAKITASTVTIQSGYSSHVFTIQTSAVSSTQTVTITATAGSLSQTAVLTVVPALKSVTVSPSNTAGGTSTMTNRVYLNGNADANTIIMLSSSSPSIASVPSSVTVQQGYSSHTFTITTMPVTSTQTVYIYAIYGGVRQVAQLAVTP